MDRVKQWFKLWRRWQTLKHKTRDASLRHMLRAMFWLNRNAQHRKGTGFSRRVYALKTDFLRWCWQMGIVDNITKQEQVLTCNFCGGDGDDPYDWDYPCRKCDGTGIYRHVLLYKFRIGHYVWHQPAPLVEYLKPENVAWDTKRDFVEREKVARVWIGGVALLEWYFAMAVSFLAKRHVDVSSHQLITLSGIVGILTSPLRAKLYRFKRDVRRMWRYMLPQPNVHHIEWEYEDIPF